ncbi:MAG: exodeoxyribonuclease VII small subunit [Gemmatimonadota bacterium]|jgi:exodeoxyribonuclease VII small subunit|nr:exodeoxyribonuclease VII small subunit [Gemmatimonadota bacterium]MDP6530001.1 exodeoxyribonuclease VII small subunit [Gemmatimonadota bacterium]MDP6802094.1 exodeoxyribonuclease VII small subunit [Gemmatimonadota bacterium]MDP7032648.1 exodeoxyribonuclease VII small subunit [Gemmatimonadota bacterium]
MGADDKKAAGTFEESLARLEEIVALLETGEAPLAEGLGLFEEGVALSRACHEMLSVAENRVKRLVREEDGKVTLDLFGAEASEA